MKSDVIRQMMMALLKLDRIFSGYPQLQMLLQDGFRHYGPYVDQLFRMLETQPEFVDRCRRYQIKVEQSRHIALSDQGAIVL